MFKRKKYYIIQSLYKVSQCPPYTTILFTIYTTTFFVIFWQNNVLTKNPHKNGKIYLKI